MEVFTRGAGFKVCWSLYEKVDWKKGRYWGQMRMAEMEVQRSAIISDCSHVTWVFKDSKLVIFSYKHAIPPCTLRGRHYQLRWSVQQPQLTCFITFNFRGQPDYSRCHSMTQAGTCIPLGTGELLSDAFRARDTTKPSPRHRGPRRVPSRDHGTKLVPDRIQSGNHHQGWRNRGKRWVMRT